MRYKLLFIFLTFAFSVQSQTTWSEKIEAVQSDGYYNIAISQELIGLSAYDQLSGFRIFDEQEKEIPYFAKLSAPVLTTSSRKAIPILTNVAKDSVNTIVFENKEQRAIDYVYVDIKKADVRKTVRIRGANELDNWYMVKDVSPLHESSDETYTINFPKSNYRYYEIIITNSGGSPLRIQSISQLESSSIYGEFTTLPIKDYSVKVDSLTKNTIISFHNALPYRIARLTVSISKPDLYQRSASITSTYSSTNIQLSSRSDNVVYLDNFRSDSTIQIAIYNQNNPGLQIDSIHMEGLVHHLCAYLEAGEKYTIKLNDYPRGRYDIEHFKDEIPEKLPIVKTYGLESFTIVPPAKVLRFYEKPIFLWSAIIVAGLILALVCIRSFRELSRKL